MAVQTVYFHFGNKRSVLKEAVDVAAVWERFVVDTLTHALLGERSTAGPR